MATATRRTIQGLTFDCHGPSFLAVTGRDDLELLFTGDVWQLWTRKTNGQPKLLHVHRNRDNLIGILAYVFCTADALPEGYIDGGSL